MTREEFGEIVYLLKNGWSNGHFDEDMEAAYSEFLVGLPLEEVRLALHKLARGGARFLPTVGEILAATQPPVPTFEQAWSEIRPVISSASKYGERGCIEQIRDRAGDLVAGWVASYGAIRLSREPIYDDDRGQFVMRAIRESYVEATASPEIREITTTRAMRALGEAITGELSRAAA